MKLVAKSRKKCINLGFWVAVVCLFSFGSIPYRSVSVVLMVSGLVVGTCVVILAFINEWEKND